MEDVEMSARGEEMRTFTVESQSVHLELDFQRRAFKGRAEINVVPQTKETRTFRFSCRQCVVTKVTVDGKAPNWTFDNVYAGLVSHAKSTVHQHHMLKAKVEAQLKPSSTEELVVSLPRRMEIKESEQYKALKREAPDSLEASDIAGRFASFCIVVEYESTGRRDGLQWNGCESDDNRWPHVYTMNSAFPGVACCLFPCVDSAQSRNPWNISINTPRTLADAFRAKKSVEPSAGTADAQEPSKVEQEVDEKSRSMSFTELEREQAIVVACSGELTGESVDANDPTRKIYSFSVPASVAANQIAFAVGPFEDVDLSVFREVDDDEKLGEAAIRVHGFCLPGRAAEVRNCCMPLAKAIDFFTTTFTTYTGESYKLCFVDGLAEDTTNAAGFSITSTRLLFPEEIIDPLPKVTRQLVFALASQWSGIHLVAKTPADSWVIAGIASFMTDTFLKTLCGRNDYRFHQKFNVDSVCEQDINRPSLHDIGRHLELDPEECRFMTLKAGVVFFILDQRFLKVSGSSGMVRVVGRILNSAKSEEAESSLLTTDKFIYQCTKSGHQKLDAFFNQWVYNAGCPSFQILQEMNKKKLQILMTFTQTHNERNKIVRELDPANFLREAKEDAKGVWAGEVPTFFVGPMTVSIHEADGTPYDHTVEIPGAHWVTQIPYNTKYKRMRRGRRQRERKLLVADNDGGDDVLLYSLGDVLQAEEDIALWRLSDWDTEMEQKMAEESYEWVRMDADFEWLCQMSIRMPAYMWMSQLQQDKDVVAQMESLQWVSYETRKAPHPLISTFLLRTLLDKRYYHGIRTMAAERLPNCAKPEVDWIGLFHLQKAFQELYCISSDSPIPKPNDFSNRNSYLVQCAIIRGLAEVKDSKGRAPVSVTRFLLQKLKLNDNTGNDFSDVFYISTLMTALTKTLTGPQRTEDDPDEADAVVVQREAIAELQRIKRIYQWLPSYQDTLTITSLECMRQLAKANVPVGPLSEFLHYTRPEHGEQVRVKAFQCLVDLDLHKNQAILLYMLQVLSTDPSPFVRDRLWRAFGHALGKIAIGEAKRPTRFDSGLVIEKETNQAAALAEADLDRRRNIPGAVKALKAELGNDERFQAAMWQAVNSPVLSLREVSNLLLICGMLFATKDGLLVTLKLPRYWQCKHTGDAKLKFTRTGAYRTRPSVPHDWTAKPGEAKAAPKPSIISLSRKPSMAAPPTPVASTSIAEEPRRTILKLKTKSFPASTTSVPSTPSGANGVSAPFGYGSVSSSDPASSPPYTASSKHSPTPASSLDRRSPSSQDVSSPKPVQSLSSSTDPSSAATTNGVHTNGHGNGDSHSYGFAPLQTSEAINISSAVGNGFGSLKKRKSETPQPPGAEMPPVKKTTTLKIKLGGFAKSPSG